ncbi:5'-deoxynucleotidase [Laedolimicola ammoniilytica]|uniref:5'-deoxynucleotidase n=1 Tax=Laedolimicola ammoniilytica TaxID=2981771 RepID=A0ABT2S137_9FIRM|nr:5'-deoxynucleotidase [Laedolimicola ammoniilytica]MCU6698218.1 5'-deoxynucleotidase [Laedolimicola ammoniilytica]SCH65222.1 5'-nucleotidase yfbR [uncultured Clostridium sp.]SCI69548.1 5'-nucleotidase yfbR [uncultured Clostridium sp.]
MNNYFAMMSRMKYIDRWALMRNTRAENLSEHSLEVSMIAHALAILGNTYLGKELNAERAAVLGLYHDATEIITGDMPTPIKYYNPEIRHTYQDIEEKAGQTLLSMLPEEMRVSYERLFTRQDEDAYLWKLVKAADKLSAYIKCIEEEGTGNREFVRARETTLKQLHALDVEEAELFFTYFIDAYGKNLDELTGEEQ